MCCLVWMLFIREFVYVLSGVNVVYTRILSLLIEPSTQIMWINQRHHSHFNRNGSSFG